jgi:hypothetical protein
MSNQWLRLWHDMPTDPKWRTISKICGLRIGDVVAAYTFMLVSASMNKAERGVTQCNAEDIASLLDIEISAAESLIRAMQGRVLDGNKLTGWATRQPKREDDSSERVRAYRSNKEKEITNVTQCNSREDKEEDKNKNKKVREGVVEISPIGSYSAPPPRMDFEKLISIWNDELGSVCPKIQRLTEQRKRLLANRLRDSFDSDSERWRSFCRAIRGSPFCSGENDRGWRANIDWALKPQTIAKVLEGFYEPTSQSFQPATTKTDLAIEEARKRYVN